MSKPESVPEVTRVKAYLKERYDFGKNEVLQIVEQKNVGSSGAYEKLDLDSIFIELQEKGYKYPYKHLQTLLRSKFVPKYNPFLYYFESLPKWDGGIDWIEQLSDHVTTTSQEFFKVMFKKALVRCIACALAEKENRIVFLLVQPEQYTGKSTFIRYLNPWGTNKYYTEAPLSKGKDVEFRFSENFIYNLEELNHLTHIEVSHLKATISRTSIKKRKPYAENEEEHPRRCNFFGSTNNREFLTESINSRWLPFEVIGKLDYDYKKNMNINDVWSQAYTLYKSGFDYSLTPAEFMEAETANIKYMIIGKERHLIQTYFKRCRKLGGLFLTSTQIVEILSTKVPSHTILSPNNAGKALAELGYVHDQRSMHGNNPCRGWWVNYMGNLPSLISRLEQSEEDIARPTITI